MARGRKGGRRTRHNARSWILKVLQESKSDKSMPTSEIQRRVATLSGSRIPSYSIYQALRTLVKKKLVMAARHGRELTFTLASAVARKSAPMPAPVVAAEETMAPAAPAPAPLQLPHKLAPGDASIIHVGETHVETVTNVHGKIVVERHRRATS